MTYTSTVTQKGQITIPIKLRRLFNLKTGHKIIITNTPEHIAISPAADFISLKGSLKTTHPYSDTKADRSIISLKRKEYAEKQSRS